MIMVCWASRKTVDRGEDMDDDEEKKEGVETTLTRCARCRGEHEEITFHPLTIANQHWSHYAMCPDTDEPIMMQIVEKDDQ